MGYRNCSAHTDSARANIGDIEPLVVFVISYPRTATQERNGTIEFIEFVIAMAKSVNDIDAEKEIKEAFDVFDKDGNGHINVEELRYVSVNLGETFSDEDIAEMLKQADFDGNGVVNYKELPTRVSERLNERLRLVCGVKICVENRVAVLKKQPKQKV
ncbi:hypothetical protein QYM36_014503 [Artemia franciscana]|uniref:EF-hand domain-containing protein n=1 Tax=Artemia franciscana TaxID=6661 RepID=A0AA88KY39_ARTSF|nr:hypothetical protein QYM36_014503 [Artemia franciscana]